MEEDIKILENYLKNSAYKKKHSEFFKNCGWEIVDLEIPQALEHLIKAYKKKEADLYSADSIINEQIDIIKNSVSKDKIKELINKIDNKANRIAETYKYSDSDEELARKKGQVRHYENFIKELQELLEGDE